jgi:hypothetical protein
MAEDSNNQFGMIGSFVLSRPRDIKIDSNEGKIYWTDDDYSCIFRADTDGANIETIIAKDTALPVAIDLDRNSRKIYWSNFAIKSIQRADFDGSNVETIVNSNINYPYGIALDTIRGRIYWLEPYDNQIRSTKLDGTDLKIINGVPYSWGIAIDEINGNIYWSEIANKRIARSNLDGGEYKVILSFSNGSFGFALDVPAGTIYWGQYDGIYRANIDGSNPVKLGGGTYQYDKYGIALGFPGPDVYWTSLSFRKIGKLGFGTKDWLIKNWTEGIFDGDGHKISNLTLTYPGPYNGGVGFFSFIEHGECRNLILVDPNITAPQSYSVGAIAGRCDNLINCAVENGNIRGYIYVGGLAGKTYGTIRKCRTSSVNVWGNEMVSAFVGTIDGMYAGTIEECFSDGNVSGNTYIGGILGYTGGYVRNCYSTANVHGNDAVGGLSGFNWGSMENSYSKGYVSGTTQIGGLLGKNEGLAKNCFWDIQTSGQVSSAAGFGRRTAEMMTRSTFISAGWDFIGETANGPNDIWFIREGKEYPRFVWENNIPVANAGSGQTAYAWIDGIAEVTLDANNSYDPDGDTLTYLWKWTIDGNNFESKDINLTIELPAGQWTFELTVNDGISNSTPDQVIITIVEPIKSTMCIIPKVINRFGNDKRIMAMLRLPAGITRNQIDSRQKLILYPGEIEASYQFILPYLERGAQRVYIIAYFDKSDLLDAIGRVSKAKLDVVGQLKSGQYFYGSDTIWIINLPPLRRGCGF